MSRKYRPTGPRKVGVMSEAQVRAKFTTADNVAKQTSSSINHKAENQIFQGVGPNISFETGKEHEQLARDSKNIQLMIQTLQLSCWLHFMPFRLRLFVKLGSTLVTKCWLT